MDRVSSRVHACEKGVGRGIVNQPGWERGVECNGLLAELTVLEQMGKLPPAHGQAVLPITFRYSEYGSCVCCCWLKSLTWPKPLPP